jgi:hypothetical protein
LLHFAFTCLVREVSQHVCDLRLVAGVSGDGSFSFGSPGAAANGAVSAAGSRKALYAGILSKLRALMVNRMAKPEVRRGCSNRS